MSNITIYCKIVAIREGQYTEIVVEDLQRDYTDDLKFVTVVKLPNWDAQPVHLGDCGYLQFQCVKSGESTWFSREDKNMEVYKYTNNYFINFIKETKDLCKQKEFNF